MRPVPISFAPVSFVLKVALALMLAVMAAGTVLADDAGPPVLVAHLNGTVDPVSARYLQREVTQAEADHAAALVITIDTPGGQDASMRDITKAMLQSSVPTVAYVAPSGARAASAGVFIAQAANLVAMAPGTNIGAAHPVDSNGNNIQSDERAKVTNDAAAYVATLAKQHGRNDLWVQDAVTKSVSITAQQAVQEHVADLLAPDLPTLLKAVDGRTVATAAGQVTVHTRDATILDATMSPFEQVFQKLADPNIAYLLFIIGFYAIIIELFHPGALLPGFTGAICLILAFMAFSTLPMNWAGVLLIAVAVALFVLDIKATAHGVLTLAGAACFIVGSLMLYNPPGPRAPTEAAVAVAWPVLAAAVLIGVGMSALVVGAAIRLARRGPVTGLDHLTGSVGTTTSALTPRGTVTVAGQLWSAEVTEGTLAAGEPVRVVARRGLTLVVEPVDIAARLVGASEPAAGALSTGEEVRQ